MNVNEEKEVVNEDAAASNKATIAAKPQFSTSELMSKLVNYALHADPDRREAMLAAINDEDAENAPYTAPDMNHAKNASSITAKAMKEDLEVVLSDEGLTEEFKTKATILFEAAVSSRVAIIEGELKESYEKKLEETFSEAFKNISEKMDDYLDYVAETWIEENAVAIDSNIKLELAESFMGNLKNLFEEHYIEIPEEKVDIVEALTKEINELKEKENSRISENISIKKKLEKLECDLAFNELAEGLADTQREKLKSLAEGVEFASVEDFKSKVNILKENHFKETGVVKESKILTESVDLPKKESTKEIDPAMKAILESLKKTKESY